MSANNLTKQTLLKTATARGDQARGVVYLDRRLQILEETASVNQDCRKVVLDAIADYPSYQIAVESMQYIAAVYNETRPDSRIFQDMMNGQLIRNWRNSLVALHQSMQTA